MSLKTDYSKDFEIEAVHERRMMIFKIVLFVLGLLGLIGLEFQFHFLEELGNAASDFIKGFISS